jgi:hypothetical protein
LSRASGGAWALLGLLGIAGVTATAAPPEAPPPGWRFGPPEGVVYHGDGWWVGLDGRFAADWVAYDDRNVRDSELRVDRALLGLSAAFGERLDARVLFDLDGIDTRDNVWEARGSYTPADWARVSAGLLRMPLGIEHALGEGVQALPGLPGFVAFLTHRTDWGVRLDGQLRDGMLYYELTGAAGEGFDLLGQRIGGERVSARIASHPLRFVDWAVEVGPYRFPLLSGLFVSGAYAWSPEYDGHLQVATPLRNTLFDVGRLEADARTLWVAGYGIDLGPVRAIHEFTRGSLEGVRTAGGRVDFEDQITAWQLVVSWRVTGEPYDSRPFHQRDAYRPEAPARPLDGEGDARGIGSVELAFRYANGDIDRDFFQQGLTAFDESSQEFRVAAVALNWDATAWLRVSGEVVRVIADQYPDDFDSHGRDTSGLVRVQVAF